MKKIFNYINSLPTTLVGFVGFCILLLISYLVGLYVVSISDVYPFPTVPQTERIATIFMTICCGGILLCLIAIPFCIILFFIQLTGYSIKYVTGKKGK